MSFTFPAPLSIDELCRGVDARIEKSHVVVRGMSQDSRSVEKGDLYCCIRGGSFDGHAYISDAIQAGAVAILVDAPISSVDLGVAVITVDNVRQCIGAIAANGFQHPGNSLTLVGITGTNGKTSTAAILASILEANGHVVDVYGTLTGERTTPEAIELQSKLRTSLVKGSSHVVMEVSSHALHQGRVNGFVFDVSIFTNIARDHLDYHGTDENYFAAKAMLFTPTHSRVAVVNADDPRGQLLIDVGGMPMRPFTVAHISEIVLEVNQVAYTWHNSRIVVPMGGFFTVMNSLAAVSAALELGVPLEAIVQGCAQLTQVPGRFESVPNDSGIGVIVDYAHTPDGLTQVLTSARELTAGALIVVFGCGGDRDQGKRALMGVIASENADRVIVTSDNPRSEDPQRIADEILSGMSENRRNQAVVEIDRAKAISSAIYMAKRGDIVVVAGKGHEKTQEINGVLAPFSDVQIASQALKDRKGDAS